MTQNQLNFLLSFFRKESFVGAENIATTLIKNGSCIVAGKDNRIWNGGIGNFIKTSPA